MNLQKILQQQYYENDSQLSSFFKALDYNPKFEAVGFSDFLRKPELLESERVNEGLTKTASRVIVMRLLQKMKILSSKHATEKNPRERQKQVSQMHQIQASLSALASVGETRGVMNLILTAVSATL